MPKKNQIANEDQNQQRIVEPQMSESRNNDNQSGNVATIASPSLSTEKDADEPNAQTTNVQSPQKERDRSIRRGPTGPRTERGKQRSSRNAIKFGVYSKKLILENESQAEFDALRNGLWEDFPPRGTLETEVLTDMLANRWERRRVLRAKKAVLAERRHFMEFDGSMAQEAHAWDSERSGCLLGGMLKPGCNHFELRKGIEILDQIRRSLQTSGFDLERDRSLLQTLYGTNADGSTPSGVFRCYVLGARCAPMVGEGKEDSDPDKLKEGMVEVLDEEIRNLSASENAVLDTERIRRKYRADQALVLIQEALDRYSREDTRLSREFDRLLSRLERLQRVRKGRTVLPPIQLNVTP